MLKNNPFYMNRYEILWNAVNSGIAGLLVFAGALSVNHITTETIVRASTSSLIVFLSQFKKFWESEKTEYRLRKNKKAI